MNLNSLENAFFPLPINPRGARRIITGSHLKRTCTLLRLDRRVVGGIVVTLLSNGHRLPLDGVQHLSLSGTFAPDKQRRSFTQHPKTTNRELPRCIWRGKLISTLLFSPARGFAKMSVGCVILACTLLVGASAVRWVNFYTSFRLIVWKYCTAVFLSWALLRAAWAFESGSERLTLPRSVALKATWCV